MKHYTQALALLLISLCTLSFTACNDDDDELSTDDYSKLIVGTWMAIYDNTDDPNSYDAKEYIRFQADGNVYFLYEYYENGELRTKSEGPRTYYIQENRLYFSDIDKISYTITKLDSKELIMNVSDNEEGNYTATWKRVNS